MSEFEDDLKGMFAAPDAVTDEAFTEAVGARIARHERLRTAATQISYAGIALSAAAMIYAAAEVTHRVFPQPWLTSDAMRQAMLQPSQVIAPVGVETLPLIAVGVVTAFSLAAAAISYIRAR